MRVDSSGSAKTFGDEPLVIAHESNAPVFVAAQRYEAGVLAERFAPKSHSLHLLDDGFQHRQLHRDVDIVLIDRRDWVDDLLPAGRLREPLDALHRAHVIAIPRTMRSCGEGHGDGLGGPALEGSTAHAGPGHRRTSGGVLRDCAQ